MIRAVVMNDTSTRYHHGCARVMRLLRPGPVTREMQSLFRARGW